MWCLYPNKNAILESVENAFSQEPVANAFSQEPVANSEVTSEKVYFIIILITVFLIVDIQIIVVTVSVAESWACEFILMQPTLFEPCQLLLIFMYLMLN